MCFRILRIVWVLSGCDGVNKWKVSPKNHPWSLAYKGRLFFRIQYSINLVVVIHVDRVHRDHLLMTSMEQLDFLLFSAFWLHFIHLIPIYSFNILSLSCKWLSRRDAIVSANRIKISATQVNIKFLDMLQSAAQVFHVSMFPVNRCDCIKAMAAHKKVTCNQARGSYRFSKT